jgi:fructose-1,6-bisphosphatase/inositol monophosphatase family enzyme
MADAAALLEPIRALHARIRDAVVAACEAAGTDEMSAVAGEDAVDTIYAIDRVSEETLLDGLREVARHEPLVLMAEGIPGGSVTSPAGTPEAECRWRVLVDPIDGTRGLMYQKRSAWILTGIAPNRGAETRLRDITLAVQTEIPLVKQHLSDQLWATRGAGFQARRFDRVRGTEVPLALRPSRAETPAHGFATVCRFFPGVRDVLGAVDDEVIRAVLGPATAGKADCFEDQYACTGGQLYELVAGHDRFVADLRTLMKPVHAERGLPAPLCVHPYDLCAVLIAEAAGVVVTGADGAPLDAPFTLEEDVSWIGYANEAVRRTMEPALQAALRRRGLGPEAAA